MTPIEIIDKTFIDDKALLRLAMLLKHTQLFAEDDGHDTPER
jgi:hypothetical protein